MKILIACVLVVMSSGFASAGECVSGKCNLRSRTVTVAREVIAVPVEVTRRTLEATRSVGRRTVARVRSVVR
jgi:hypothetical protein